MRGPGDRGEVPPRREGTGQQAAWKCDSAPPTPPPRAGQRGTGPPVTLAGKQNATEFEDLIGFVQGFRDQHPI